MAKQRVITLLTDFGTSDHYVAAVKGVMLAVMPEATLVDITHELPPGDILAGAFVLAQALPHFPPGTVHCVVVDPTVGTDRRALAAVYGGQTVVFPDNGVITLVNRSRPLEAIAVVRDERYFLSPSLSSTFHGRDLFAPVAAHLAAGLGVERLGPQPENITLLELPEPQRRGDAEVLGQVLHVDRFGNLISNIPATMLGAPVESDRPCEVFCGDRPVGPLRPTYAVVERGRPLALINSMGLVEVAVNGGSAAEHFGAGVGAEIRVRLA